MKAIRILIAAVVCSWISPTTTSAQTPFQECGVLVDNFGLCTLLQTMDGSQYLLDNYGTFVVGDLVLAQGVLDPTCGSFCAAVPCVNNTQISACPQQPFAECGVIVDNSGLCLLLETMNGSQYFLDNYGTFTPGDFVEVQGILDPTCANLCASVPCIFNTQIVACPQQPFAECGLIVDNFGSCLLLETMSGNQYFLDNYGAFGPGDIVEVQGILDPTCLNTCAAVPCIFNTQIAPCPQQPFFACGVIVDNMGLCMLLETIDGSRYFLDNYGAFAIGDFVEVQGILDPTCLNLCASVPCVFNTQIAACPYVPFVECGMIVDNFGLCMLFETIDGTRYFLDNYGTFMVGDIVEVQGLLDVGCSNLCAGVPCVLSNLIDVCSVIPTAFLRGDCNDDGTVNIADPVALLNRLFVAPEPTACEDACDANDDGALNIADPVAMLAALFQSQPLPSPSPGCGPDATPSSLLCASSAGCP